MQIIITAGNHDSASRLEAPRPLLSRHKVEIRGSVKKTWQKDSNGENISVFDYNDLIIPVANKQGEEIIVLTVPFLRFDIIPLGNYSQGVNKFLKELTAHARKLHPGKKIVMMAHMYADGAEIPDTDASERIVIGGQEKVYFENWEDHPDYFTSGHIHKRQHIWKTKWARYTGSILPMSFSEINNKHGVDLVTFNSNNHLDIEFLEYTPQHTLRQLPKDEEGLPPEELKKLIKTELRDLGNDKMLSDNYDYVKLKLKIDITDSNIIKEIEDLFKTKDAVICKIEKISTYNNIITTDNKKINSVDDIVNRDPLESLHEAFFIKHKTKMNEHQEQMLRDIIDKINNKEKNI
jgi:exonuclease SbcD